MFRILVSDKLGAEGLERLAQATDVHYDVKPGLSKEDLLAIIPDYEALIIRSGTKADADLLNAGTNLIVVGRAGMGVDNVDVETATMRGIIVMNTPGANSVATAEQTMALMLATSRHTAQAHGSVAAGEWKRSSFTGQELYHKTLGIVGFGRIGRLVAERAQAFGMSVIAYDPFVSEHVGRELNVTLVDLDELWGQSDYITLHTSLTPETQKIINENTIAQMKDGVILINVARGKLVDEAALAAALKSGKVKAAGLDVFSSEPPAADNPVLGLPNVIHTPHLGASSVEAQREVAVQIVDQVLDVLRGVDFRNAVNMPFQVGTDFAAIRPYLSLAEKMGHLQADLAPQPIERLEMSVRGDAVEKLVKAIASGLLKGMLMERTADHVNYTNAPLLAQEYGVAITQTTGAVMADYPNEIICRAFWEGGERLIAGVLFGGSEPRIVQVDNYKLEAKPEGFVLVLQNQDVPGVIGQVGTILSAYGVNIGEWRLGRDKPGGAALSFINLDSRPSEAVMHTLEEITAVTQAKLVALD